ncbi:MAG: hypothetical protein DMG88_03550 [Acidobacteria bacterium]|nr:MAG: hypothetical protein DMG88_03550 [Acidobacteriota bacterium]
MLFTADLSGGPRYAAQAKIFLFIFQTCFDRLSHGPQKARSTPKPSSLSIGAASKLFSILPRQKRVYLG